MAYGAAFIPTNYSLPIDPKYKKLYILLKWKRPVESFYIKAETINSREKS